MVSMVVVQTTFEDRDEAVYMAQKVVQKRLAACAQLSRGVQSFYWWNDSITDSEEYVLSMKTTPQKYGLLERFIVHNHSYETPEILGVQVDHVTEEYSQWLRQEVEQKQ